MYISHLYIILLAYETGSLKRLSEGWRQGFLSGLLFDRPVKGKYYFCLLQRCDALTTIIAHEQ